MRKKLLTSYRKQIGLFEYSILYVFILGTFVVSCAFLSIRNKVRGAPIYSDRFSYTVEITVGGKVTVYVYEYLLLRQLLSYIARHPLQRLA